VRLIEPNGIDGPRLNCLEEELSRSSERERENASIKRTREKQTFFQPFETKFSSVCIRFPLPHDIWV
jgi:hypothetical protein